MTSSKYDDLPPPPELPSGRKKAPTRPRSDAEQRALVDLQLSRDYTWTGFFCERIPDWVITIDDFLEAKRMWEEAEDAELLRAYNDAPERAALRIDTSQPIHLSYPYLACPFERRVFLREALMAETCVIGDFSARDPDDEIPHSVLNIEDHAVQRKHKTTSIHLGNNAVQDHKSTKNHGHNFLFPTTPLEKRQKRRARKYERELQNLLKLGVTTTMPDSLLTPVHPFEEPTNDYVTAGGYGNQTFYVTNKSPSRLDVLAICAQQMMDDGHKIIGTDSNSPLLQCNENCSSSNTRVIKTPLDHGQKKTRTRKRGTKRRKEHVVRRRLEKKINQVSQQHFLKD